MQEAQRAVKAAEKAAKQKALEEKRAAAAAKKVYIRRLVGLLLGLDPSCLTAALASLAAKPTFHAIILCMQDTRCRFLK